MTLTNQKISKSPGRISFVFPNCLPRILMIVFTSRNVALIKNCFHYTENLFPPAGMKDFVEKCVFTRRKKISLLGVSEKLEKKMVSTSQKMCCLLARISSVFSNCVPLGGGFHQRKSSSGQKTLFRLDRKSASTSLIWDFLENTFYYTEKLLSL